MKNIEPIQRRNLHKIFYIFVVICIVFCSFKSPYLNTGTKKNQNFNNLISWISDVINGGTSYKFSEADGNVSSLKNYDSYRFTTGDASSFTSNYHFTVSLIETTSNLSGNTLSYETPKTDMNESNLLASVPAELLAGMDQSQIQALSGLTTSMSASQIISKMKEDKSFRQDVQNVVGSFIGKDLQAIAANYK